MKENPKIDILMATYNGGKYIREQIESIIYQTYSNWNLYVQDDCSKDETAKIVESYATNDYRIKYERNETGLGALRNFEKLMYKSEAKYIMFCDQDDVWLKEKIEESFNELQKMESDSGTDTPCLVYTDQQLVDQDLNEISFGKRRYDSSLWGILCQNHVYGCTTIFNRALLKICLPIPEYVIGHDYWMALMASAHGRIQFLDKKTMLYRQHQNNVTGGTRNRTIKTKIKTLREANKSLNALIRQNATFAEENIEISDAKKYVNMINSPKRMRAVKAVKSGFRMDNFLATLRMLMVISNYE